MIKYLCECLQLQLACLSCTLPKSVDKVSTDSTLTDDVFSTLSFVELRSISVLLGTSSTSRQASLVSIHSLYPFLVGNLFIVPQRKQVQTILPDRIRTLTETPGFNKLPHPLQKSLLMEGSL